MEHDLKKLIVDLLASVNDTDLLDLVYKVLLECSTPETKGKF
jgi:hypothetical protein